MLPGRPQFPDGLKVLVLAASLASCQNAEQKLLQLNYAVKAVQFEAGEAGEAEIEELFENIDVMLVDASLCCGTNPTLQSAIKRYRAGDKYEGLAIIIPHHPQSSFC